MRVHKPAIVYVTRHTKGKSKLEIMRCPKRFIAGAIYHILTTNTRHTQTAAALDGT